MIRTFITVMLILALAMTLLLPAFASTDQQSTYPGLKAGSMADYVGNGNIKTTNRTTYAYISGPFNFTNNFIINSVQNIKGYTIFNVTYGLNLSKNKAFSVGSWSQHPNWTDVNITNSTEFPGWEWFVFSTAPFDVVKYLGIPQLNSSALQEFKDEMNTYVSNTTNFTSFGLNDSVYSSTSVSTGAPFHLDGNSIPDIQVIYRLDYNTTLYEMPNVTHVYHTNITAIFTVDSTDGLLLHLSIVNSNHGLWFDPIPRFTILYENVSLVKTNYTLGAGGVSPYLIPGVAAVIIVAAAVSYATMRRSRLKRRD